MRARDIPGIQDYPDLLSAFEREYQVKLGSRRCGGCVLGPLVQKYKALVSSRKAESARYSLANTGVIR